MSTFIQLLFGSIEIGSVYALAALGMIIIFRTSRMTNFAQGSLGMFSAYAGTMALMYLGLPTWLAVVAGMITAFFLGIIIDLVIMRRAKNVSPLSKQIITFGLIMLLTGFAPWIFGTDLLIFPKIITEGAVSFGGANLTHNALLNISVGLAIMLGLFYFLQRTKWGLAVRVTASNPVVASMMGVPTNVVTMGAWAIAASLGALSALMLAPAITVNVSMMDKVQINALIAVVFGGFQTFHGPVIAAYIIGISRSLLSFYVSSTWGDAILYGLILIFIVFRPNGLIGKKRIKKV